MLLDARLRLLAIGRALYPGTSPKATLDATARVLLLPALRTCAGTGRPRDVVQENLGQRWRLRTRAVPAATDDRPVAVLGCYVPEHSPMPEPPPVGGWAWRSSPPGPDQTVQVRWPHPRSGFPDTPTPSTQDSRWWEAAQWLDEVVAAPDRPATRRVLAELLTSDDDALRIHEFTSHTGDTRHRMRLAGWRDTTTPGPDTRLRGVVQRLEHRGQAPAEPGPDYLDAALALTRDPLCAVDVAYEHIYLTSPNFPTLDLDLPAHRHLPRMTHPEDLPALRALFRDTTASANRPVGPARIRLRRTGGGWRPVEVTAAAIRPSAASPPDVLCRLRPIDDPPPGAVSPEQHRPPVVR